MTVGKVNIKKHKRRFKSGNSTKKTEEEIPILKRIIKDLDLIKNRINEYIENNLLEENHSKLHINPKLSELDEKYLSTRARKMWELTEKEEKAKIKNRIGRNRENSLFFLIFTILFVIFGFFLNIFLCDILIFFNIPLEYLPIIILNILLFLYLCAFLAEVRYK